jgi:hypothetical protein
VDKLAVFVLPVAALLGCSNSPAAPLSGDGGSQERATVLSLRTNAWTTISDPMPFPLANDASGHLIFDFPTTGSMNYLDNVEPPKAITGPLSVSLAIQTAGLVVFNYMTEPFNTCATPGSVRPFFWSNRDGNGEFDRWWSNPTAYPLAGGTGTLTVPLTPDRWSSVFGKAGNADASARAGFDRALTNVSSLGLTFGGGCFFGHGVNVSGGSARFVLMEYRLL